MFVCTGNICRSPMAERMTQGALVSRLGPTADAFEVTSAGTRGLEGRAMEPNAQDTLQERGADPRGFVARQLTERMVEGADIVLCATRSHRSEVVTMSPRGLKRTFTIRELGRLTADLTPADIAGPTVREMGATLVERAVARRGLRPGGKPTNDDINDPYLQELDAFRTCAQLIADAMRGPVDLLTAALRAAPR